MHAIPLSYRNVELLGCAECERQSISHIINDLMAWVDDNPGYECQTPKEGCKALMGGLCDKERDHQKKRAFAIAEQEV